MEDAEQRIETAIASLGEDADEKLRQRLEVWKLRLAGYSHDSIASQLNIGIATSYRYVRWCIDNLPAAYDSVEQFREISLSRLDRMIEQLESGRETGDDTIHRTTAHLMDMQAKLLGGYAPTQVDGTMHVKYTLESGGDDDV